MSLDEDIVETLLDDDSQDEFENSNIFASLPKTARQLAKEKAGQGVETPPSELVELPADVSKKVKMTENEIALKRSETARRRRNQTEKKLEDDKIEVCWSLSLAHVLILITRRSTGFSRSKCLGLVVESVTSPNPKMRMMRRMGDEIH